MFFLGREDLTRHRADRVTNSAPVSALGADDDEFEEKTWADVCVGDIVKIRTREAFPADLLLLRACDPAPGQARAFERPPPSSPPTCTPLALGRRRCR